MELSFRLDGSDSGGISRSMSSTVGLAMPAAASSSAALLPLSPLWPLVHLKHVGAGLDRIRCTVAVIHLELGTFVHAVSS